MCKKYDKFSNDDLLKKVIFELKKLDKYNDDVVIKIDNDIG